MDEKAKNYISEQERRHRAKVLIDAGLYKKVYLEDLESDDYDPADVEWDNNTLKEYLKVPYDVTDEEFEELERYTITRSNTEESKKARNVAAELWNWSSTIKQFGVFLLIALILLGIFTAYNSSQLPRLTEDYSHFMEYEVETEFSMEMFITVFAQWLFYAFVEFCLYNAISVLLAALASIVENTQKAADAAAYNAYKKK